MPWCAHICVCARLFLSACMVSCLDEFIFFWVFVCVLKKMHGGVCEKFCCRGSARKRNPVMYSANPHVQMTYHQTSPILVILVWKRPVILFGQARIYGERYYQKRRFRRTRQQNCDRHNTSLQSSHHNPLITNTPCNPHVTHTHKVLQPSKYVHEEKVQKNCQEKCFHALRFSPIHILAILWGPSSLSCKFSKCPKSLPVYRTQVGVY